MASEKPLLTLKIHGSGFKPGRMPIPLLVKVCEQAQDAINRQARAIQGKKTVRPGPVGTVLARECTLELSGIKKNCTTLNFTQAADQAQFDFASLGMDAVRGVGAVLNSLNGGRRRMVAPDTGVLDSLYDLGEVFEKGISRIDWIARAEHGKKSRVRHFVPDMRTKIAARIQSPAANVSTTVEGVLQLGEGKCSINTSPVATPVVCGYEQDHSGEVIGAIGRYVRVQMDSKHKIEKVELTGVPAGAGGFDFFNPKTIDQLIAEQCVSPISDLSAFAGALPDEDVDELVAETYRDRQF
jgi:hypothetical protein